jgi:hypothetical protein
LNHAEGPQRTPCVFQAKRGRSGTASLSNLGQARGEDWLSRCVAVVLPKINCFAGKGYIKSFIECREEDIKTGSEREAWWGRKAMEGGDNQCIRAMDVHVDVL